VNTSTPFGPVAMSPGGMLRSVKSWLSFKPRYAAAAMKPKWFGRTRRRADDGRTLQHLLVLEIGKALERRIERNGRRVRDSRASAPASARVGTLFASSASTPSAPVLASWMRPGDERLVREARGDERLPLDVDAALLQELLGLDDVADHLLRPTTRRSSRR
jgi:hypothetical protein